MKKLILISTFLFFGFAFCSSAKAAFIVGLEDIPLAKGFTQIEEGWSFGNEESRMIEVYLTSQKASFAGAAAFYRDTLPQMGWQIKKEGADKVAFEREGETLELDRESTNPLRIRLTVKSKN